ncbi:MAG: hypothetical protein AAGD35_02325 [Actinomycetota bacterium]
MLILSADSPIAVEVDAGDAARVRLGADPDGVTLIGDLQDLHRVIIEIDRQLSREVAKPLPRT